jgi:hypothetical protein
MDLRSLRQIVDFYICGKAGYKLNHIARLWLNHHIDNMQKQQVDGRWQADIGQTAWYSKSKLASAISWGDEYTAEDVKNAERKLKSLGLLQAEVFKNGKGSSTTAFTALSQSAVSLLLKMQSKRPAKLAERGGVNSTGGGCKFYTQHKGLKEATAGETKQPLLSAELTHKKENTKVVKLTQWQGQAELLEEVAELFSLKLTRGQLTGLVKSANLLKFTLQGQNYDDKAIADIFAAFLSHIANENLDPDQLPNRFFLYGRNEPAHRKRREEALKDLGAKKPAKGSQDRKERASAAKIWEKKLRGTDTDEKKKWTYVDFDISNAFYDYINKIHSKAQQAWLYSKVELWGNGFILRQALIRAGKEDLEPKHLIEYWELMVPTLLEKHNFKKEDFDGLK